MISPDLITSLASTAANAIVSAAATDAWQFVREAIARMLGKAQADQQGIAQAERLLETTEKELADDTELARGDSRQALTNLWEEWLAQYLRVRPAAAEPLAAFAAELHRKARPNPQLNVVTNIAEGGGIQNISVGGTQYVGGHQ